MKPITEEEIEKLKEILDEIEDSIWYTYKNSNGGFVKADMFDYDDEFFDVEIKEGIQNDVESSVYTSQIKIDRNTFEVID